MAGYVPISKAAMNDVLIDEMGFGILNEDNFQEQRPGGSGMAGEIVYSRDVVTTSGVEFPYRIKVYSTIGWMSGWSDECGADAIRVVLIDKLTGKPAAGKQKRVHRTKNALTNLRERCRDLYKLVLSTPSCPKCGGMLDQRENRKTGHKFLGCSRYAPGKPTHCDYTAQISQEAA